MDRKHGSDRNAPRNPPRGGVEERAAKAIPDCLKGRSADEVLTKVEAGDPLGIEASARQLLRERAVLIDLERLVAHGMARVAYSARAYRGWPPVEHWLRARMEHALESLLEEDRERLIDGGPLPREDEESYAFLCDAHGVTSERAVAVAVVFNDLPEIVRRCYYESFVMEKGIEGCAASGLGTKTEVERHLLRALSAMSTLRDPARPNDGELE